MPESTDPAIIAAARAVFVRRLLLGGSRISDILQELAEQVIGLAGDDRIERHVAQHLEDLAIRVRDMGR